MRDTRRITRICEKLRIIWELESDQRLGQLLTNLSGRSTGMRQGGTEYDWETIHPDLFGIEDDEWERRLDIQINKLDSGIECYDGEIRFRDKNRMVKKDELYED